MNGREEEAPSDAAVLDEGTRPEMDAVARFSIRLTHVPNTLLHTLEKSPGVSAAEHLHERRRLVEWTPSTPHCSRKNLKFQLAAHASSSKQNSKREPVRCSSPALPRLLHKVKSCQFRAPGNTAFVSMVQHCLSMSDQCDSSAARPPPRGHRPHRRPRTRHILRVPHPASMLHDGGFPFFFI